MHFLFRNQSRRISQKPAACWSKISLSFPSVTTGKQWKWNKGNTANFHKEDSAAGIHTIPSLPDSSTVQLCFGMHWQRPYAWWGQGWTECDGQTSRGWQEWQTRPVSHSFWKWKLSSSQEQSSHLQTPPSTLLSWTRYQRLNSVRVTISKVPLQRSVKEVFLFLLFFK